MTKHKSSSFWAVVILVKNEFFTFKEVGGYIPSYLTQIYIELFDFSRGSNIYLGNSHISFNK